MSNQGGYAIVDVDEEAGDGRHGGLEFKTFLSTDPAPDRSTSPNAPREAPAVPYSPFNIAYYQTYFDVDTNDVLKRVAASIIPRENFITDNCDGQIDLYGPFWTLSTLILALYITSTLTSSITQYLASPETPINSNLPLLSTALSIVYLYGLGVPALLWGATKWLGIAEWGLAEAMGLYGYAMSVFIPISLLCLIPVGILRWILVGCATGSSGYFLIRNIHGSIGAEAPRVLFMAVVALHAGMALAMKILFFSYSVNGVNIGPDPIANPL